MAFVSPFKKWRCFYCYKEVQLGLCAIYNWKSQQEIRKAPRGWFNRLRARFFVETLDGPFFVTNFASRQCPHCMNLLPPNIEIARNIVIAVLGDNTVGKTYYIAACINQLSPGGPIRHLSEVGECQALNQEVEQKYYKTLYEPIFIKKDGVKGNTPVVLFPTEKEKLNDPLIYTMTVRRDPLPEKAHNLIIYDASGEDLANQETLAKYKSYALNPDAIIYIADPLTIPGIEERIPLYKKQSLLAPEYVLRWTVKLIKTYQRLRGARLTIPTAITLSKSDLLEYIEPDDAALRCLKEANYIGGFNIDDIEAVDLEVKDLLGRYGAYELLSMERVSENTRFFAASATGCRPNPDTGRFDEVKPRRCLDPLLWVLFKLGVINAKSTKESVVSSQSLQAK